MIKLVLLRREAKLLLTLVSDPLPRTLGPELRQVPFKGPQCVLPQISPLVYGHNSVPVLVVHRRSKWNGASEIRIRIFDQKPFGLGGLVEIDIGRDQHDSAQANGGSFSV